MGEMINVYRLLVGILEGRALERPWSRWEDNIKLHLKETGCECVDWIHFA
jgi:hypothetical protein